MARCRYLAQFRKATDGMAAEKKTGDCSRTEHGENGEHFGTDTEEVSWPGEAGEAEREMLTEDAVPELCLVFLHCSW